MKPYTYLLIDLGCILIPFLASFFPKRAFYKKWKAFFLANFIVAIPFLIWDAIFTHHDIWGFNEKYLTGISVYNLPIEEILFFICIPYACVFTYFAFQYLFPKNPLQRYNRFLTIIFGIISLSFILFGYDQWYTLLTGFFTLLFITYAWYKKMDLSFAFLAYFAILPFFLISNGLLTGSCLAEPIVWYNDAENFGVRMFTIPIEDSIYGFLLIMLNIVLFQWFSDRRSMGETLQE